MRYKRSRNSLKAFLAKPQKVSGRKRTCQHRKLMPWAVWVREEGLKMSETDWENYCVELGTERFKSEL